MTLSSIMLLASSYYANIFLKIQVIDFNHLLRALLLVSVLGLTGALIYFVSLVKWIFVLTVFCRFWLCIDIEQGQDRVQMLWQESKSVIWSERSFLTRFSFAISLLLIAPSLVFCGLLAVKLLSIEFLWGMKLLVLSPIIDTAVSGALLVVSTFLLTISFIALPIAAQMTISYKKLEQPTVSQTMKNIFLTFYKNCFPAVLLSLIVSALNLAIANPQIILLIMQGEYGLDHYFAMDTHNFSGMVIVQIWQGLTSVVLYPCSLAIFCELLRTAGTDHEQQLLS